MCGNKMTSLIDGESVRDVILFPHMKTEETLEKDLTASGETDDN